MSRARGPSGPTPWRPRRARGPSASEAAASGVLLRPAGPASSSGGSGSAVPFKRKSGGVRVRRKSRVPALIGHFVAALLMVGLPAAGVVWIGTAPQFAIRNLEIETSGRVGTDWVEARLSGLEGENLLRLPLVRIESRLAAHPWVAGVEATKLPPDRLRVVVVERQAVALLDDRGAAAPGALATVATVGRDDTGGVSGSIGSIVWIDADGAVIAPLEPEGTAGAASLDGAQMAREETLFLAWGARRPDEENARRAALAGALAVADRLEAARPEWGAVHEISILGEEDFLVESGGLPFPLLVGPESFGDRLEVLDEILPELEARYRRLAAVDLRFSHRIVVQPAAEDAGTQRGAWRGEPYGKT